MPELIEMQSVLEIAMKYCPDDDGSCSNAGVDLREMLDEIEALPIVHIDDMTFKIQNAIQAAKPSRTVEITFVRHGRWIKQENGLNICSACGVTKVSHFPFCGHCGAQMDGGADNG